MHIETKMLQYIWWCKDCVGSYGTDAASVLFYKRLLKVWFALDNAIFLLQEANVCITVTETGSTMLLFIFVWPEYVFVNSPATSTQLVHLEKTTIPPSCPSPYWVSSVHKQGWILWPYRVPHWLGDGRVGTLPAPKQTVILKETENNSSGNDFTFFPKLTEFVEIRRTSDLFKTSNWLILAIISCLRVSGFFSVSMKGLLWHCSDRKLGSLSSSLIDDHWNRREHSFEET